MMNIAEYWHRPDAGNWLLSSRRRIEIGNFFPIAQTLKNLGIVTETVLNPHGGGDLLTPLLALNAKAIDIVDTDGFFRQGVGFGPFYKRAFSELEALGVEKESVWGNDNRRDVTIHFMWKHPLDPIGDPPTPRTLRFHQQDFSRWNSGNTEYDAIVTKGTYLPYDDGFKRSLVALKVGGVIITDSHTFPLNQVPRGIGLTAIGHGEEVPLDYTLPRDINLGPYFATPQLAHLLFPADYPREYGLIIQKRLPFTVDML